MYTWLFLFCPFVLGQKTWVEQTRLEPAADSFGTPCKLGTSLALSFDGGITAIGGSSDNTDDGAVWIYRRTGTNWFQDGPKLVGHGGFSQFPLQGINVALNSNGDQLAIAGFLNDNLQVAAWIFIRTSITPDTGIWNQQGSILIGNSTVIKTVETTQPSSIGLALSGDGNYLALGEPNDQTIQTIPIRGAAYIFARDSGEWKQVLKINPNMNNNSRWGSNAAISNDGTIVIFGSSSSDSSSSIFLWSISTRVEQTWSTIFTTFTFGSSSSTNLPSLSISYDGTIFAASIPGYTFIFSNINGSWSSQTTPKGITGVGWSNSSTISQGSFVSFASSSGKEIMIGSSTGEIWSFSQSGPTPKKWYQQGKPLSTSFPISSGIVSGNGNILVVGSKNANGNEGIVSIFATPTPATSSPTPSPTPAFTSSSPTSTITTSSPTSGSPSTTPVPTSSPSFSPIESPTPEFTTSSPTPEAISPSSSPSSTQVIPTPSSSSTPTPSFLPVTPTPTASTAATNGSGSTTGMSPGTIAGITIPIILVFLLVVGGLIYYFRLKKFPYNRAEPERRETEGELEDFGSPAS